MHCRVFSSILDLCPLDSSSNFLPRNDSQKCPQTWPQIPPPEWSTINPQVEKPLFQMYDFPFQEVNWFKKICSRQVLVLGFPASKDLLDWSCIICWGAFPILSNPILWDQHDPLYFINIEWLNWVMYGCESWTIKKAECQRIDTFELWVLRRLLRVPWIARSSNQSILKEISPEYSLKVLMLKLQYFGHLMRRNDSFEEALMLEKIEGRRRRGRQRMKRLNSITDSVDMSLSNLPELVVDRRVWVAAVHRVAKSQPCLSDWTELN